MVHRNRLLMWHRYLNEQKDPQPAIVQRLKLTDGYNEQRNGEFQGRNGNYEKEAKKLYN